MTPEQTKAVEELLHFSKRATLETPGDTRLRMAACAVALFLEAAQRERDDLRAKLDELQNRKK